MDAAKTVLRRKFLALDVYIRKEKKDLKSIICFHLREQEKVEQIKSKISRRKDITIL